MIRSGFHIGRATVALAREELLQIDEAGGGAGAGAGTGADAAPTLAGDGDGDDEMVRYRGRRTRAGRSVVNGAGPTRCGRRSELEGLVGRQYAILHEYRGTSSRPAFRSICSAQLSSLMRKAAVAAAVGCDLPASRLASLLPD